MSDRETEEERLVREVFSPDALLARRPLRQRPYLLPPPSHVQDAEAPVPAARPPLVLIQGGKED